MTSRLWMVALLGGCRGAAGGGDPTFTPTDTDATFLPAAFGFVAASFGVADGALAGALSAEFQLHAQDGRVCTVGWAHPGPLPRASWGDAIGALFAVDLPPDADITSDCGAVDAPEVWGDPTDVIVGWGFGLAITAAPTEDTLGHLSAEDRAALDGFLLGGGSFYSSASQDEWTPNAIGWGADGGTLRPVDEVLVGGQLVAGDYELLPQTLLQPASALLGEK